MCEQHNCGTVIVTCLCVDVDKTDANAHYPQLPYLRVNDRRLVYWKCALVFFATSRMHNRGCRHVMYSNDGGAPVVDGVDVRKELLAMGVEVIELPFARHRPPEKLSRVFRNNFYKLDVVYDACRRFAGRIIMLDSDAVWLGPLPSGLGASVCLYRPMPGRDDDSKVPTGISNWELGRMFDQLSAASAFRKVEWIGGELVAGPAQQLQVFTALVADTFREWCRKCCGEMGRFSNQCSMFDNDEIVLSFAASRYPGEIENRPDFMRRIWTESGGGGQLTDLELSVWHLPNEKLRGISVLFDDMFVRRIATDRADLAGACGVPSRLRHYRSRRLRDRLRLGLVGLVKGILPRVAYNRLRGLFRRDPI